MRWESAFTMDSSSIKFGPGATRGVGHDMSRLGSRRVLVVTDPFLSDSEPVARVLESLRGQGIDAVLFDQARVEPTDTSMDAAIEFATKGQFDGYVGVGGGSSLDTAKVANLYATFPAEFLAYVNPPIGQGTPVPGKLKPMIAIPTTAGTGRETTGVAIFDYSPLHAKTGIAHRALRPLLGIVDPSTSAHLRPTDTGLTEWHHIAAVDRWLGEPVEHVRELRSQLLMKLALLDRRGLSAAAMP